MIITSPSLHTIEDIRADAECTVIAVNPKEGFVLMSVLLRTNTTSSPINTSIHGWLPYAVSGSDIPVKLGDNWSLTKMIPPDPGYFAYVGGIWENPDFKVKWVVFRTMGNIEPNDYALLTKLIPPVPKKMLPRNQEVFFNETTHISGVPDGKAYMRCKRIKKKGDETANRITPVKGLEKKATDGADAADKENATWTWIKSSVSEYVARVGFGNFIDAAVFLIAIVAGVYAAYSISGSPRGLSLAKSAQSGAKSILRFWNMVIDKLSLLFVPLLPILRLFRYSGNLD
jgi:hypothetical protein